MRRFGSVWKLTRRKFAFWIGFGLFVLGDRLRISGLDGLAAKAMQKTEPASLAPDVDKQEKAEHWTAAENEDWRWLERETWIDGRWVLTGITTPINKRTGQRYLGHRGYLDERLAPARVRGVTEARRPNESGQEAEVKLKVGLGRQADPARRARHGRPPSKWLRSLEARELRIWLKTIDVPEAGVSGMTFWTHLTRDHSFDPEKIDGLTIDEQAKLHAAAHFGF